LVEENYLKAIYHLSEGGKTPVSTTSLAESMNNKAASVTDMIKRLSTKGVITYEKYYGVNISSKGKTDALRVIRKHRLWETFLVQKLDFNWDEVHEVAEQLEHIQSPLLIEKLEAFLGFPVVDPHGHPIPDKHGKLTEQKLIMLSELPIGRESMVKSVKDGASAFLQYLSKIGIYIGAAVQVIERVEFDGSLEILIDGNQKCFISRDASENLMVTE
jgi:DtxR family Mn-dependent transcriptional regulator